MLGDGTRCWYAPGSAVSIPEAANTNGLWVLSPAMLGHMLLAP